MNMYIRIISFFIFCCLLSSSLFAQYPTRSGRMFSPVDLRKFPCGGEEILEENFADNIIPVGWEVRDLDSQQPAIEIANPPIAASAGWALNRDLQDFRNNILVSPSWYEDTTQRSDDWLISPQITLGENTCLSWLGYSIDPNYPESYEVRISVGEPTIDSTGFFATPPIFSIDKEDNRSVYRSANLAGYAGQSVYIAFRHTSKNQFALALDDIRLANVNTRDITPFALDIPESPQEDDEIEIKGGIRNLGSDTLTFDTTLTVAYSIDQDTLPPMILGDSIVIAPNDSIQFIHDSIWTPLRDKVYRVCLWVNGANDMNIQNDTACFWVGVGRFVGIDDELKARELQVYPNPVEEQLTIRLGEGEFYAELDIRLIDLHAREILRQSYLPAGNKNVSLSLANIPTGVYILQLKSKEKIVGRVRIVKR